MRRTPRSLLGTLVAVGALIAGGALATPAAAGDAPDVDAPSASAPDVDSFTVDAPDVDAPDVDVHPAVHVAAGTSAAQERVRGYWTADRMRDAVPLDQLASGRADRRGAAVEARVPEGPASTVTPVAPAASPSDVGTLAFPEGGAPWTGGGEITTTGGRVFFTYQGRNASCSGNAVNSANGSTVMTAGHCVKMDGAWHTNWVFVPGYHDGQAPYGQWAAEATLATPQWTASEDINYDVGAAVVTELNGQRLTDVVGGQGLSFNSGYNREMYAFGFPAADPYDGETFTYCSGTSFQDFFLSSDHGLSCDMTGGSSGGPWLTDFDETTGTGLQTSVNSFGYAFWPDTMFGPYFGDDARNLYDEAQTL
ncbi:trypsin-like serine peptidase [Streptomyces sp. WMMC897]|uniref:trypsin-like serine peptidase n=1 Tax=Streptomyces sp. WMMC897 TaxID=3014782 RepID=UPI0022B6A126|nr:peptidase [Streptomyces sp. WMMC897]MCZ7417034.1 peptidase [Streptomyces sp. WMMC897]